MFCTTFARELALAMTPSADHDAAARSRRDRPGALLIVDDDPMARALYSRNLRRAGHAVESAASYDEALTWLGARDFDILLIDYYMPKTTGLRLIEQLAERGLFAPAQVIVLSTVEDPRVLARCHALGVRRVFRKPVAGATLRSEVKRALRATRDNDSRRA